MAELEDLRDEAFANDIAITDSMLFWTADRARLFFEMGGAAHETDVSDHQLDAQPAAQDADVSGSKPGDGEHPAQDAQLLALLEMIGMAGIADALAGTTLDGLLAESGRATRPVMLAHLKQLGVASLPHRQKLATAIAKHVKGDNGAKPALATETKTSSYTGLPKVTQRAPMAKDQWREAIKRSTPGDTYGISFPHTHALIAEGGAGWLTKAFQAFGSLELDNAVEEVVELKECLGGGAAEKGFLTVRYTHARPGLHTRLFCKFPRTLQPNFDHEPRCPMHEKAWSV